MRHPDFDPEDIVQRLQGTCDDLSQAFGVYGPMHDDYTLKYPDMTEDDLIDSDYNYIDNFIFLCAQCGWWCDVGEAHDNHMGDICDDCHSENGEEEDW